MTSLRVVLIASACLAIQAVAAEARGLREGPDHIVHFRSPTGNLQCAFIPAGDFQYLLGNRGPEIACVRFDPDEALAVLNARGPAAMRDDEFEWPDNAPVLSYGETFARASLNCISAKNGITCMSAGGHGFTLSRTVSKTW